MTDDALDRMLAYHRGARHYPGALVHVERDGKLLARRAFGTLGGDDDQPLAEDTRFRIASLTKPVVSLLALMLVDDGLIELDAPIAAWLPQLAGLRLADGSAPQRQPSVRDLLRHTAGMPYLGETRDPAVLARARELSLDARMLMLDADAFLAALAELPLAHEPGTAFRYGFATDVLGCLIERVTGQRLGEALRRRVLEPLGMHDTRFGTSAAERARMPTAFAEDGAWFAFCDRFAEAEAAGRPFDSGGGGLVSTLDDYARFARALVGGFEAGGQRLLKPATFEAMCRDQLGAAIDGPFGFTGPGFGFGLGLAVRQPWGAAAFPCATGELTWSGVTGTLLFAHPGERWFAIAFTCNTASRMMTRFEFRRTVETLSLF